MVLSDIQKAVPIATKIFNSRNSWAAATSEWNPTSEWQQNLSFEPKRRQGRPSKQWDDNLKKCDPLFSGVVGHGCLGPAKIAIPGTFAHTVLQQYLAHEHLP